MILIIYTVVSHAYEKNYQIFCEALFIDIFTVVLSYLAFEWKWGWRWPFYDRNLTAFGMLIPTN